MTAVIGILNKSGIAIAADSAVTIENGEGLKIYNSAYKIFTLSKHYPVSIMIYNSASYMGISWETIIKEYRKKLKDNCFEKLIDYQTDFITFLKDKIDIVSPSKQSEVTDELIGFILKKIIRDSIKKDIDHIENLKSKKLKKEFIKSKVIDEINYKLKSYKDHKPLVEFKDYKIDKFRKEYTSSFRNWYKENYTVLDLGPRFKAKLFRIVYNTIVTDYFYGLWTGLVFTGFGENEIYPSLLHLKVGEIVSNRIRYFIDSDGSVTITDENNAVIKPFAQRDVIDTILSGLDRRLEVSLLGSIEVILNDFLTIIKNEIEGRDNELIKKLEDFNVEKLVIDYSKKLQQAKWKIHITPLMNSIATLSKEDLAELAESLVYLTYMKRRMSFSEESVGGPIDVAIITKGDGFIWIKRKHYFSKELNQDYIYKYLKS